MIGYLSRLHFTRYGKDNFLSLGGTNYISVFLTNNDFEDLFWIIIIYLFMLEKICFYLFIYLSFYSS